jgi:uncharacterized protein
MFVAPPPPYGTILKLNHNLKGTEMVRRLIKSLLKETAYPEPTSQVRLIETHVSFIFLTDSFVYKVKKPVDYGFLNFSTVDRRRFYCEEEVRLNSRLCPEIYLGVVELREGSDGGSFTGAGRVVDYAVKMKRLPEERMLSHLLERGEVTPEEMERLGRHIGEFHDRAQRGGTIDRFGEIAAIRGNWEENFSQAVPFQQETLPAKDLALLRSWVERFLSSHGELLAARIAGGFIRECDGDLHVGNICLGSSICIFDCIEFNERFRFIDTASDIAFLLMDLEYAGRRDLCPPFIEAYRQETGDRVPPELLDFYMAYRAFVRGKVKSFLLKEPGFPAAQLAQAKSEAARYFRLARGFALRERLRPPLIVTCGLMGSGKSAVSREIAFQLGLRLERSDLVRKSLPSPAAGRDRSPQLYDGGSYTAAYNEATYQELLQRAREELQGGRGIVVDATFRRGSDRERFRALAVECGVPFFIVETSCPERLIRERLERRRLDPNEPSEATWELFPRQKAEFEAPAKGESIQVDTSAPLEAAVDRALKGLGVLP